MKLWKIVGASWLGLLLMISAAQAANMAERVQVQDPWVGAPPPFARALGGFMVLKNPTDEPVVLVNAQATEFGSVMLHRSVNENGVHRMIHVDEVEVPRKGELHFKHGGYHIMFMQPKKQFKAGDVIPVTLVFKDGSQKTIDYPVKKRMMMHH